VRSGCYDATDVRLTYTAAWRVESVRSGCDDATDVRLTCTAAGRVWKVMLDAVTDSRAYTITAALVASPSQTIQLRDVLFGDVWLCVGQLRLRHSVAKVYVYLLTHHSSVYLRYRVIQ